MQGPAIMPPETNKPRPLKENANAEQDHRPRHRRRFRVRLLRPGPRCRAHRRAAIKPAAAASAAVEKKVEAVKPTP
jgi:hypothetical protein